MKKTLVSVLTMLLVAVMVFAGFAPTIANAQESAPAPQSIMPDSLTNNHFVDLEKSGDELILTLNPDVAALKGMLTSEEFEIIVDKILAKLKDVVAKSLKDDKAFLRELWAITFDLYAEVKGQSIAEIITNKNLPSELIAYAKAVIWAADAADIVDA